MEEKKGINPVIKVVLLIIFVAIACVSSWFIGKNMAEERIDESNKVQENANQGDKVETREVNALEKTELMNVIDELSYIEQNVDKVDEENPLSDEVILKVAFNKAVQGLPEFVVLETVNLYANKYFGKDVVPGDIPCYWGCLQNLYKYDAESKRFVYNEEHFGHGAGMVEVFNKFESATLTGNVYTITVYKAFSDESEFFSSQLYPTYKDAIAETNKLYDMDGADPDTVDLESEFEAIDVSKLNKFTYTFEKKNGNYILKSYKMN